MSRSLLRAHNGATCQACDEQHTHERRPNAHPRWEPDPPGKDDPAKALTKTNALWNKHGTNYYITVSVTVTDRDTPPDVPVTVIE